MRGDAHVRLIATNMAVLVGGLLLLGVVFSVLLASRVTDAHLSDLRYETSALAAQIDGMLARNTTQVTIQRLMTHDSALMGKRIVLLDRNGVPRYDSGAWTPFSRGSWRTLDVASVADGTGSQFGTGNEIGLRVPLRVRGRIVGTVAVIMSSSDLGVPWSQILSTLVAVIGLAILCGILIAVYQVRSLIRPLRQVSNALMEVQGGRYHHSLPEEGWREVRILARRYNEMVVEVAQSHQVLRDFMANAAHELKTPIALIAGFARALKDGTAAHEEAVEDAVGYIESESAHLARVVEELFALASLDATIDVLNLEMCDPAELVHETLQRYEPLANADGKTLWWRRSGPLPPCTWDAALVASALGNLISNALDHTVPGDTIWAELEGDGESCVYRVHDTGSGISPEDQPHIFERFYRGRETKRRQGHAGLGLAIVREVARRHGGTVTVESEYGQGTCFSLTLPIAVEAAQGIHA